jgi:mono/diheme cytochrome c family protein
LNDIFGKPAEPHLNLKGVDQARKSLALDDKTLAKGSRYYRIYCMHCHGVSGDGRGPTAGWVNPHPRDYRPGLFKFQSVDQSDGQTRKPLRDDLLRTLTHGVEGTAMPAFNMLSLGDREALVSYVILLSLRGETELATFQDVFQVKDGQLAVKAGQKIAKAVKEAAVEFVGKWEESQTKPINAVAYPKFTDEEKRASVKRGQALFLADITTLEVLFPQTKKEDLAKLAGTPCGQCHTDYGRQALFKFDKWGTMVRPANLTTGVFRGGRRPIDLYWRIHSGINGSNMVGSPVLTGAQTWDLVNFLQALPYPNMLKDSGIDIH